MIKKLTSIALCFIFLQVAAFAQAKQKKIDILKQYTICTFDDGLKIKEMQRLDEDSIRSRAVKTKDGEKEVTRIDSFYVLFTYPKMSPFANVRPERSQLVKDLYESDKKNVVEGLRYALLNSREMATEDVVKTTINGFEVNQLFRKSLYGGTLGIAALFNDTDFTITTIYFFNAEEKKRNFQTIDEWIKLRDNFLNRYTQCINTNLGR